MPIPLIRLPLLVLDEVIKNVGIKQLFILSLCSKRMNLVLKKFRDKSMELTISLRVDSRFGRDMDILVTEDNKFGSFFSVSIQAMPNIHLNGWRAAKLSGTLFDEYIVGLRIYLDDVKAGTRPLLQHMLDIFCTPINVSIHDNRFPWVLDMIENLQGPGSYNAFINDDVPKDEQFRRLLVDWKPSTLGVKNRDEAFRIRNSPENIQEIEWSRGKWLTIENLLTIDCNRLTVDDPKFTVTEMNRFFRHVLIHNGAPRLTYFEARLKNDQENERILDGIREVLTPIDGKEQFEENERTWKFSGMLNSEDRTAIVSIERFRIKQPAIYLERFGARLIINPQ